MNSYGVIYKTAAEWAAVPPTTLYLKGDADAGQEAVWSDTGQRKMGPGYVEDLPFLPVPAYTPGGTDVAVADGGTGKSSLASGKVLKGAGTSPVDDAGATINDLGTQSADYDANGKEFKNAHDPTTAQSLATRAYVLAQIAALINSAPGILDTLGEIATELQADESVAAALATTVAGKLTTASYLSEILAAGSTAQGSARTNIGAPERLAFQTFSASGTWTRPTVIPQYLMVIVTGGAGGGGAGRLGTSASLRGGGGGGGPGQRVIGFIRGADVGATETVTIGAGGAGGAAQASSTTDGAAGSDGAVSSFGSWLAAFGGKGGVGGTNAGASAGGAAVVPGGAAGAPAGVSGAAGVSADSNIGRATSLTGAGGGGGGSVSSGGTESAGGSGGSGGGATTGAAGGAVHAAGTAGTAPPSGGNYPGGGGGGGGGGHNTNGGAGGAGATPGAGGGGGGGGTNASQSGAGGDGGDGRVTVIALY